MLPRLYRPEYLFKQDVRSVLNFPCRSPLVEIALIYSTHTCIHAPRADVVLGLGTCTRQDRTLIEADSDITTSRCTDPEWGILRCAGKIHMLPKASNRKLEGGFCICSEPLRCVHLSVEPIDWYTSI